jgi:hypothetical protein
MTVKGFVRPINVYKVLGTYQELVDDGRVVLQERDDLRVLVDLTKQVSSESEQGSGGGAGRAEAAQPVTVLIHLPGPLIGAVLSVSGSGIRKPSTSVFGR